MTMIHPLLLPMAGTIHSADGWDKIWGAISGAFGENTITTILGIAGTGFILWGLFKYFWAKRKGGGADSKALGWNLLWGALCLAPIVLIPIFLRIVDFIVNFVINLINTGTT